VSYKKKVVLFKNW